MTNDAELDALIVRNIGDLEAAIGHAKVQIDMRLWEETAAVIKQAIDAADWHGEYKPGDKNIWIANRSWLEDGADPVKADAYFWLAELPGSQGDGNVTWVATFTGSGSGGAALGLFFHQELIGKQAYKRLLRRETTLMDCLRSAGVRYEPKDNSIYFPITLDREELARAFGDDDIEPALQPIADAFRAAIAASTDFDALITLIRKDAAAS